MSPGKTRPMGLRPPTRRAYAESGFRVYWLCLESFQGMMECWSIEQYPGEMILRSRIIVLFTSGRRHLFSGIPILHHSRNSLNQAKVLYLPLGEIKVRSFGSGFYIIDISNNRFLLIYIRHTPFLR